MQARAEPRPISHTAEALRTPESGRTPACRRWPLGSRVLAHALNLAEALRRLSLSPLTFVGMPRNASRCETPVAMFARRSTAGIPLAGRVRPCRAHRAAGNRPQRFLRASSAIAFELRRVSAGTLSRATDQRRVQLVDARTASEYERRSISRHVESRSASGVPAVRSGINVSRPQESSRRHLAPRLSFAADAVRSRPAAAAAHDPRPPRC